MPKTHLEYLWCSIMFLVMMLVGYLGLPIVLVNAGHKKTLPDTCFTGTQRNYTNVSIFIPGSLKAQEGKSRFSYVQNEVSETRFKKANAT